MRCVTLSNGVSLNAEPERSRSAPWQRLRRTYGVKDCLDFVQTTAKLLELVVLPLHVRSLNYFLQSQQSKNANVIFFTIKILFTYSSFYLFYSFSHFKELLCLQHHAVALICKLKKFHHKLWSMFLQTQQSLYHSLQWALCECVAEHLCSSFYFPLWVKNDWGCSVNY